MFLCADEIVLANLPFKEGKKCLGRRKEFYKKIIILKNKLQQNKFQFIGVVSFFFLKDPLLTVTATDIKTNHKGYMSYFLNIESMKKGMCVGVYGDISI